MSLKFIDLFAGIGGFHQAVKRVEPESYCVSSIEFDKSAAEVYERTYGIKPLGDITNEEVLNELDLRVRKEKGFDILFAGFPCQTFSQAGKRQGFNDEIRGTLFYSINEILKKYKPKYFVLENVRNLINHKSGRKKSFDIIKEHLKQSGYNFRYSVLSPHRLKNNTKPQMRERVFIYGVYNGEEEKLDEVKEKLEGEFYKKNKLNIENTNIYEYVFSDNKNNYLVEKEKIQVLKTWESFVKHFKENDIKLFSPIWLDDMISSLDDGDLPRWKRNIIIRNKEFYNSNQDFIDKWKNDNIKYLSVKSHRKFEWNANDSIDSIFEGIIQFRPSGIRVKKPDFFPTFVAINHKAIIGKEKRYITPCEVAELYGFKNMKFTDRLNETYKQLGNTISVDVAETVIKTLIEYGG